MTEFEDNEGSITLPEERRKQRERRSSIQMADRRKMSYQELWDLQKEAGCSLSIQQAHLFRRAKIMAQAVGHMLEGSKEGDK